MVGWDRGVTSGSAIQLRLLAAVFRLVLSGAAPELERFYPCLGGEAPPNEAWPAMRQVIRDHSAVVRAGLEVAPQTNEVGRSAALLAGLFDLVAASGVRRVRLIELGASAGLNLLVDQFAFAGISAAERWNWGPANSPVQLVGSIEGPVRPESFAIIGRRGCDLDPVDATTPAGRLLLTSFVWPFNVNRHERLAGALAVAARQRAAGHPVVVDAAGASSWLPGQLVEPAAEVLTVVWHSITQLYWPPAEVTAVEQCLTEHGSGQLVWRVGLEFDPRGSSAAMPELRTQLWQPGRSVRDRRLGTAHHHGPPVRLATIPA